MINTIDGILEAAKGGKTGVIAVAAAHDEPVIEAVVEARIADLEATLKVARVIDDSELSGDTVSIGMNVTIQEEGEEPESYDITGSTEADMNLNRISDESPVGAALIGHKPGDEVDVTLPNGSIVTYKLLTVTRSK